MTPIKRGTSQRLGLRHDPRPRGIAGENAAFQWHPTPSPRYTMQNGLDRWLPPIPVDYPVIGIDVDERV